MKNAKPSKQATTPRKTASGGNLFGLDLRPRGARDRWNQILSWVWSETARDYPTPDRVPANAPLRYRPKSKPEKEEASILRQLLMAKGKAHLEFVLRQFAGPHDDSPLEEREVAFGIGSILRMKPAQVSEARAIAEMMMGENSPGFFLHDLTTTVFSQQFQMWLADKRRETEANRGRKHAKQCQDIAHLGGMAAAMNEDGEILETLREYKHRPGNAQHTMTTAVKNIVKLGRLAYENPNKLLARLSRMGKRMDPPMRPRDIYASL